MIILHKLEMVNIYILFIRSLLEQSCVVWHFDLNEEGCKVILKDRYTDYTDALQIFNFQNLKSRRDDLSLRFAKKCLKFPKTKGMFPVNTNEAQDTLRSMEWYKVQFARKSRLKDSSIPSL